MAYTSSLDILETEIAIKKVKDFFESHLSKELDLLRVSAPLFVPVSVSVSAVTIFPLLSFTSTLTV